MDDLIGKKIKVLDDGYVQLVDVMGTDDRIEQAARVSYGEGTRKTSLTRGLIRYLMRHRHTTPFEMCEVCFKIRMPMDAHRQFIRHRTMNVNEYSTRYSLAIDSQQQTPTNQWRLQASNNKQGSSGFLEDESKCKQLTANEYNLQDHSKRVYKQRLDYGIAREQARKDLPLSTYTEYYAKNDLHNWFHFLSLRMDSHAQLEIREYANAIGHEFIKHLFPISWEAFVDYRLDGMFLTKNDINMIKLYMSELKPNGESHEEYHDELIIPNNRERAECFNKLRELGFSV